MAREGVREELLDFDFELEALPLMVEVDGAS
jgi:hypothetical protein